MMLRRIRFLLSVFTLLTSLFTLQTAHASTIQIPQTGQTVCYDAANAATPCTNTSGQDGNMLAGKPSPSPRFTDNGNGTVTDNLTGLIWLKNANCFGTLVWATALTNANTLASGSCGLTDGSAAGDWRLPNRKELESLVDAQNSNPSLPAAHPFSNVQVNMYWSSSSYASGRDSAWFVGMGSGYMSATSKSFNGCVWPVRAGQ